MQATLCESPPDFCKLPLRYHVFDGVKRKLCGLLRSDCTKVRGFLSFQMTLNMKKEQLRVHHLFDRQCLSNAFTPWRLIVLLCICISVEYESGSEKMHSVGITKGGKANAGKSRDRGEGCHREQM